MDDDVKRMRELVDEVRAYLSRSRPGDRGWLIGLCDALDAAQQRVRELERERDELRANRPPMIDTCCDRAWIDHFTSEHTAPLNEEEIAYGEALAKKLDERARTGGEE